LASDPREKEWWDKIKIVQLEEEFYLFSKTTVLSVNEKGQIFRRPQPSDTFRAISFIRLKTPVLGLMNITFSAIKQDEIMRIFTLTPFNPEIGYPLDADDFSIEKRKRKLERIEETLLSAVAIKGIKLWFLAAGEHNTELFYEMTMPNSLSLKEDVSFILNHLFFVIKLSNGSSFASRALWEEDTKFEDIDIGFDTFFPVDAGALPIIEGYYNDEGFDILLPDDIELLKAIKAKFLFLPDVD
jgi:hypothetical protein